MTAFNPTVWPTLQAHDVDVIRPLVQSSYGADEFAVRNPEGNLWSFGDYRGEPLPD
jgi:uncharacterized glyoxalase superfamily protein PhnB